ncbi:MAG: hypothetical protein OEY11_15195 [Gammaproteobacteria bacterium]|nr:hypothetical protein [Gammaproteobacteria bacterium]
MVKSKLAGTLQHKTGFLWLLLVPVFICILVWRDSEQSKKPAIVQLAEAPSSLSLQFMAASDSAFSYRLVLFWLQQFDVQSGQYISYRQLDYQKLTDWLEALSVLEPESQYPLLLAARVYSRVADTEKVRTVLAYIFKKFLQNADKNWRWLAEATVIARHTLKDQPLALKYATALADSSSSEIPHWARDIRLIILEDMGEVEQVKLLVGALVASKTVTDANEIRFLEILMQRLQNKDK